VPFPRIHCVRGLGLRYETGDKETERVSWLPQPNCFADPRSPRCRGSTVKETRAGWRVSGGAGTQADTLTLTRVASNGHTTPWRHQHLTPPGFQTPPRPPRVKAKPLGHAPRLDPACHTSVASAALTGRRRPARVSCFWLSWPRRR
jgi:hypothetical protein